MNTLLFAPLLYCLYFVLRGLYRLTLHPLANFPGPSLAAFTRWYEVYWEVYRDGRFSEHIEQLHQRYGPIIRINPDELHVIDPEFHEQLYNFSPEIDRPPVTIDNLQFSPSFALHRVRRKAFDPYFSKTAVLKLESVVRSSVEELCQRLHEYKASGQPASISVLARCLTADLITEYMFGSPYGFLTDPTQSEAFFTAYNDVFKSFYMLRESRVVDFISKAMREIPTWMLPAGHMAHTLMPFMINLMERTDAARAKSLKSASSQATGYKVLMEDYVTLALPEHDKSLAVQFDTAGMFVTAGLETVAFTIEQAVFHLLDQPALLARLQEELASATPDTNNVPSWTELEKLPFLSAVIQESLRLSVGVLSRLPRKNTKHELQYKSWIIPRNTYVGMSNKFTNYNAEIFPEPRRFNPDRWLQGEEERKKLERYMVSFSKGSRRCIGVHLAYAELYTVLATIFARFRLELFETTRRDVDPRIDYFIPKPEHGSLGVRVVIK